MTSQLASKSIVELSRLIRNKDIQVIELVHEMLQKIEQKNEALNAFITVHPHAEDMARQMDEDIASGKDVGALHGIPIGVKDMIDTYDMKTTMGSKIYENFWATNDAEIVKRLKQEGAFIIGKTNTHQFAYGPTGDRSYYGPMRNPYDERKMAGGSSGGSAAAVAANFCSGALGTDTSGSIRIPASFCGLVGMKPTNDSIPLDGVHPLAESLDSVGPMTKTVEDNALLMDVLRGVDPSKEVTSAIESDASNQTIGIPSSYFLEDVHQEVAANFYDMKKLLQEKGIKTRDIHLPNVELLLNAQKTIIAYESYQLHKENIDAFPEDWDPEVKERLQTARIPEKLYHEALTIQHESNETFQTVMADVDALLTPTSPILAPDINQRVVNNVHHDGTVQETDVRAAITKLTAPFNLIGLPSLTVPSGFSTSGLPLGVQLTGKRHDEAVLYQIGSVLETVRGARSIN